MAANHDFLLWTVTHICSFDPGLYSLCVVTKSSLAQAINTSYENVKSTRYREMRPKTAKSCRAPHRRPAKLSHSLLPPNSRILSYSYHHNHHNHHNLTTITVSQPSQSHNRHKNSHHRYEHSTINPNILSKLSIYCHKFPITYEISYLSVAASDPHHFKPKQASTAQAP